MRHFPQLAINIGFEEKVLFVSSEARWQFYGKLRLRCSKRGGVATANGLLELCGLRLGCSRHFCLGEVYLGGGDSHKALFAVGANSELLASDKASLRSNGDNRVVLREDCSIKLDFAAAPTRSSFRRRYVAPMVIVARCHGAAPLLQPSPTSCPEILEFQSPGAK
tara:strand:- start:20621 stop:21115 length:495 start_codon:yes stop_codon:yes gene_type:complete